MQGKRIVEDGRRNKVVLLSIAMLFCLALIAVIAVAAPPEGTMVIYGINGTEVTGSRSVILNLNYNESLIDKCRWANDYEAGLSSAPWEECTFFKAWILSAGYGNKTVYFELRNNTGSTAIYNDSIMYWYMQDYTAPTAPTVYDGLTGDDIDWWSSNTTLKAHWFNATEDISTIYYKYRILNNSACYANDCSFTNVSTETSVTVTGLELMEGWNVSFEVVAYNSADLNASAISNGTIIDLTKPTTPDVNSSTHPSQSMPYDESTAIFNFSASDPLGSGVSSGIEGYSYLLDIHPGTAPDNILEERSWNTLASMHKGSYNQTLKTNSTGYAYAVFSQLHTNMTENDSIRVRVAVAEQDSDYTDVMGFKVYLAKAGGEGVAISSFGMESDAISNIENVTEDILYAYDMTMAKVYQFDLTVNETVNDNTDDVYVVVAGLTDDDDNTNLLAIGGTDTIALVDNTTKSYVCDEADSCTENTDTLEYAIEVKRQDAGDDWTVQYDYLGDRVYYFHVKARDVAGNWGDTAHYRFVVAAGGVSSMIYSPVDNEVFTTNETTKNITVKVAVSENVSVQVVALHPDGGNYTSPPAIFDSTYEFENITLKLGENEIYAVTNTSTGAIAHSPIVTVTVSAELQPLTNKTLKITYSDWAATALRYLCNSDETTTCVGIATETTGAISASSVQADTGTNSLKIYMTRPFDTGTIASQLSQNIFLDRVNPMFGYTRGAGYYVLRNELRYDDIYLGGNFFVPPGTYHLQIRKGGVSTDGRYNVTILIQ